MKVKNFGMKSHLNMEAEGILTYTCEIDIALLKELDNKIRPHINTN